MANGNTKATVTVEVVDKASGAVGEVIKQVSKLTNSCKVLLKKFDEISKQKVFSKAAEQTRELKKNIDASTKGANALLSSIRQIGKIRDHLKNMTQFRDRSREALNHVSKINSSLNKIASSNAAVNRIDKLSASIDRAASKAAYLSSRLRTVADERGKAHSQRIREIREVGIAYDSRNRQRQLNRQSAQGQKSGFLPGLNSGIGRMLSAFSLTDYALRRIIAISDSSVVKQIQDRERGEFLLRSVTGGNISQVRDIRSKLLGLDVRTPFNITDLTEAFAKISFSGVDPLRSGVLENLAMGMTAMGKNSDSFNRVVIQLTQAMAKNNLLQEDLRWLTNEQIDIYGLLARAFNRPVADIMKMDFSGYGTRSILVAIKQLYEEQKKGASFYLRTLSAKQEKLVTAYSIFMQDIGMRGVGKSIGEFFDAIRRAIESVPSEKRDKFASVIIDIASSLKELFLIASAVSPEVLMVISFISSSVVSILKTIRLITELYSKLPMIFKISILILGLISLINPLKVFFFVLGTLLGGAITPAVIGLSSALILLALNIDKVEYAVRSIIDSMLTWYYGIKNTFSNGIQSNALDPFGSSERLQKSFGDRLTGRSLYDTISDITASSPSALMMRGGSYRVDVNLGLKEEERLAVKSVKKSGTMPMPTNVGYIGGYA